MTQDRRGGHFVLLDGLRGIAALAVVVLHIGEMLILPNWVPQAYLAVPFFFMLSGFVIGHAYEDGLMLRESCATFMLRRIERLYPMFLTGLAMAIGLTLFRAHFVHGGITLAPILLVATAAVAMVPLPGGGAFVLLPPQWSLSLEMWGNLLHYILRPFMTRTALGIFLPLALIGMVATAFRFGGLGTGWSLGNLAGGVATFAFSYGAGVFIFRLFKAGRLPRLSLPAWCIVALLVLSLIVPQPLRTPENALRDLLCAALLYPVILIAALHVDMGSRLHRAADWCGRLSYPIYIIHYPVVAFCCLSLLRIKPSRWVLYGSVPFILALVVAIAWGLLVTVDEPLRAWLRGVRASRVRAEPSAGPA